MSAWRCRCCCYGSSQSRSKLRSHYRHLQRIRRGRTSTPVALLLLDYYSHWQAINSARRALPALTRPGLEYCVRQPAAHSGESVNHWHCSTTQRAANPSLFTRTAMPKHRIGTSMQGCGPDQLRSTQRQLRANTFAVSLYRIHTQSQVFSDLFI